MFLVPPKEFQIKKKFATPVEQYYIYAHIEMNPNGNVQKNFKCQ